MLDPFSCVRAAAAPMQPVMPLRKPTNAPKNAQIYRPIDQRHVSSSSLITTLFEIKTPARSEGAIPSHRPSPQWPVPTQPSNPSSSSSSFSNSNANAYWYLSTNPPTERATASPPPSPHTPSMRSSACPAPPARHAPHALTGTLMERLEASGRARVSSAGRSSLFSSNSFCMSFCFVCCFVWVWEMISRM